MSINHVTPNATVQSIKWNDFLLGIRMFFNLNSWSNWSYTWLKTSSTVDQNYKSIVIFQSYIDRKMNIITVIKITFVFVYQRKHWITILCNGQHRVKKIIQSCIKDSLIYLPLQDWRLFQFPPHVNSCEQRELATCFWITYSGTHITFFSLPLSTPIFFLRLSAVHINFIYHILFFFAVTEKRTIFFSSSNWWRFVLWHP